MLKYLYLLVLTLAMACGGGGSKSPEPNPPVNTPSKYGIFRPLKPKVQAQALAVGSSQATVTTMRPRGYHRAIQMLDGRVLLCGGDMTNTNPTMDIFDPATETIVPSAAVPNCVRRYQSGDGSTYQSFDMVNLPDGRVVILGSQFQDVNDSIYEVYDPIQDTMEDRSLTLGQTIGLVEAAFYIGNGRILIFEHSNRQGILDVETGALTLVDPIPTGVGVLYGMSSIRVADDIFFVGGYNTPVNNEVKDYNFIFKYNILSNTWTRCHDMAVARSFAGLALLSNNRIGIYGGGIFSTNTVEIYDTASDTISRSKDLVGTITQAAVCYLQTGYTLISGGKASWLSSGPVQSQLAHNVTLNFSGSTGDMTTPRVALTTTLLNNGLVLIAGGFGSNTSTTTAEIYDPLAAIYMGYASQQMVSGTTMQFDLKDAAGNTPTSVTWSVNDFNIASISNTGLLTALTPGIVTVTASVGSSSSVARIQVIPN